jgi:predicted transcriptional regulator
MAENDLEWYARSSMLTAERHLDSIGIPKTCQEVLSMPTLKRLREDAGWTAGELATAARVSLATVNRMESGKEKYAVSRLIANKVLFVLGERLGRKIQVEELDNLFVKKEKDPR